MKIRCEEGRAKPWCLDGRFGGKRVRKFFGSEAEAEAELAKLQGERAEAGPVADRLSPRERIVFAELRDQLDEVGASMEEAVRFFLANSQRVSNPMRMEDLLEAAVDAKSRERLSERYLNGLRSSVGSFCRWEGNGWKWAHEIFPAEVSDWLESNGWAPKTRKNYLTDLSTIFSWGMENGVVGRNVADDLVAPKVSKESEIAVLSVVESARLVIRCLRPAKVGHYKDEDFGCLLPYVTLGLFCGIRPERELGQMRLGAIDLEEGGVAIDAGSAKSRSRRVVDLPVNGVALLKVGIPKLMEVWEAQRSHPARRHDFKVCPPNFRRRFERLRAACGFRVPAAGRVNGRRWAGDVMRHSFASYHYALHQNENLLKAQMGHRLSSDVLYQNYRQRVSRSAAEVFWSLGIGWKSDR